MKLLSKFVCGGIILAFVGGTALAGSTRVVHRIEGRSGYHAQRVMDQEPTTVAVYPSGRNVRVVRVEVDQKIGSTAGAMGRSGYNYAFRAIE